MTEFPIHTLPKEVQEYVEALERSSGFVPEYLCSAALSTFSTIIGNSAELYITNTWKVRCSLWIAILGNSGSKKTPSIRAMTKVLNDKDDESFHVYKSALTEYNNAKEAGESTGPTPIRKRLTLDDSTMESTLLELYQNPHGLLIKRDELLGLINDMGRYRSGGDEQRLLSIFSGESVDVARKTSENIRIKRPFLNLIGNIQPQLINQLLTSDRQVNGFASRLLYVYPKGSNITRGDGGNIAQTMREYDGLCNDLFELVKTHETLTESAVQIQISTKANNVYNHWRDDFIYPTLNENVSEAIKAYVSKLEEYAARIALIIDIVWEKKFTSMISARSMSYAIEICNYYFAQFKRVLGDLGVQNNNQDYALLKQFHENVKPTISSSEYRKSIKKIGNDNPAIPAKLIGEVFGIPKSTLSGWMNHK